MVQEGYTINRRYQLTEKLGESGIGSIFRAKDLILKRTVAVRIAARKNLPEDKMVLYKDDESEHPLFHEARTLALFFHPNILPIYDFGLFQGVFYTVMPLIRQPQYIVDKMKHMTLLEKLRSLQQLADAVDFLHENDVIHRDISPHHVIVNDKDHLYLIDFALAMAGDEDIDRETVGTVAYMAPEVLQGDASSPISDIYAFGMVAFESLTGHYPFEPQMLAQLIHQILTEDIPPVTQFQPELPIGVDIVLKRLCSKNPKERYASASAAVDDLYRVFYSGQTNIEGKVFISYARKDSDYVYKLVSELRRYDVPLWIDLDIDPGANWDDSIENALAACNMMLLIATPSSLASEYVTHEWSFFMGGGKPVYPFIPKSAPPEKMHPRLARVQHVVGTDDMMVDIANIVNVLAGGNPIKLGG